MMKSMNRLLIVFASIGLASLAAAAHQESGPAEAHSRFFSPAQWQRQSAFEAHLNAVSDPQRLRAWHDLLASEPHIAGTAGDQRLIEALVRAFTDMGIDDVQVHEFWALLAEPVDAKLEIVSVRDAADDDRSNTGPGPLGPPAPPTDPDVDNAAQPRPRSGGAGVRRGVLALPLTEDNLLDDPYMAHPGLSFGWNAYSGSGDVTAGVVYANYGTKQDFETLRSLGIDCTGKIVLARYGGNYRGFKVKYAEQAGAAGVVIYTDPDDAGFRKGATYPEGGWANDTCIQRGSIVTLDQPGDPLTPGVAATEDAPRLDVDEVNLPRIPVQPIGYRAAGLILQKMTGPPLPEDLIDRWQGGLSHAYRLTGGDDLRLRLMVKQNRVIRKSANVIATVHGEGGDRANERIYIGSHHDAWGYGAGDPAAGTMLVMEAARSFAALAKQGMRPQRSIVFACWGAEEFGIIGSTEFCEQYADDLRQHALAYINLDGATMGENFAASADPLLKSVIEEAARSVPQARSPTQTVYQAWVGEKPEPTFGTLGGGSDHIGFYCHLGIPSCFLSSGGAAGTAYHSNYDNLAWYRKTVGDDYEPALMMTRIVNIAAARLANADIPPLDLARVAPDLRQHLATIRRIADERGLPIDADGLDLVIDQLAARAEDVQRSLARALSDDDEAAASMRMSMASTLAEEPWHRPWTPLWPQGMPGRGWFRNFYASSDPDSGYASWVLPALRQAIERDDADAARQAIDQYKQIVLRLERLAAVVASEAEAVGDAHAEHPQ